MGGGGVGGGHVPPGGYFARLRARRQVFDAVEADLRERGLTVPPIPALPERVLAAWLVCGLIVGLLVGLVLWTWW
jgi:hypothetical protein